MAWHFQQTHAWASPLDLAAAHADADMALLVSSLENNETGRYSFLLLDPSEHFTGDDLSTLPPIPADASPNIPHYVGYIAYEGNFYLTCYQRLFRFDHREKKVEEFTHSGTTGAPLPRERSKSPGTSSPLAAAERKGISGEGHYSDAGDMPLTRNPSSSACTDGETELRDFDLSRGRGAPASPLCHKLASNFTRATYEACIARTIERIHAGDFYQANITRKFWGTLSPSLRGFSRSNPAKENFCAEDSARWIASASPRNDGVHITTPPYLALFTRLCALSPAPYSAYIRNGDHAILSSSPECFLTIEDGTITTRPIKGSAARSDDPARDMEIRRALATSDKNLAENLMITDLMRHDLSQVAEVGSVKVTAQSELHSYRTIHHLVSTITAQKSPGNTSYDVLRACFPPGSMTGAPKRAAMRWIAAQEKLPRGIYSGALGWFGGGDSCALSVVIRTLICDGNRFEFQVGGGIVADSNPTNEWRETLTKARAIAQVLGIDERQLEEI